MLITHILLFYFFNFTVDSFFDNNFFSPHLSTLGLFELKKLYDCVSLSVCVCVAPGDEEREKGEDVCERKHGQKIPTDDVHKYLAGVDWACCVCYKSLWIACLFWWTPFQVYTSKKTTTNIERMKWKTKCLGKKRQGGMAANDQGRKTAMGALTQNEEDSSSSRGVDNERKTPLFKKTLWSCLSSFRVHFR